MGRTHAGSRAAALARRVPEAVAAQAALAPLSVRRFVAVWIAVAAALAAGAVCFVWLSLSIWLAPWFAAR